jgi:hypothetical protein
MTNQEIFDKVARHLLTQGARSMGPNGTVQCLYRGSDGLKCAVGCLIPDELYWAGLEQHPPCSDSILEVLQEAGVLPPTGPHGKTAWFRDVTDTLGLLDDLQELHDQNDPEGWAKCLHELAESLDLNHTVLEEFQHETA